MSHDDDIVAGLRRAVARDRASQSPDTGAVPLGDKLVEGVARRHRRRTTITAGTAVVAVLAAAGIGAVILGKQQRGDRLVPAAAPAGTELATDWHYWIQAADDPQYEAVQACIAEAGAEWMSPSMGAPPVVGATVRGNDNNTTFRECLSALDGTTVTEQPLPADDGSTQEPVPVQVLIADTLLGDVLSVGLDACLSRTVQVQAEETPTTVRLRAEVIAPAAAAGSDHCTDIVQVFLLAPLGDRQITDALTGTTLTIPLHSRGACLPPCLNDPTANPPDRAPRAPTISVPRSSR